MLIFIRNYRILYQNGSTTLNAHQPCMSIPLPPQVGTGTIPGTVTTPGTITYKNRCCFFLFFVFAFFFFPQGPIVSPLTCAKQSSAAHRRGLSVYLSGLCHSVPQAFLLRFCRLNSISFTSGTYMVQPGLQITGAGRKFSQCAELRQS